MAAKITLAILGGVAALGAAGAGAYVLTKQPAGKPAVSIGMQTPPPETPPAPQAASPDAAAAPPMPIMAFSSIIKPFSLVRDSAAYVAASPDAPQMYPLRAGTAILSVSQSQDGKWAIAMTSDGQAAYLPGADLGPYDPAAAPVMTPSAISGSARVVDTATLLVDSQQVSLAGVQGRTGGYAQALQQVIDAQGPAVSCAPNGAAYTCKLPTGLDVARMALYNGGADVAPDASDDYRQQADAAKRLRRGIWQ